MNPFTYARPANSGEAIQRVAHTPKSKYLGGGTNLIDLMRENIENPAALVDVQRLAATIEETEEGGLRIGAGVTNTDLAANPRVREGYPLLSQAILSGASGQIRNMATVGGNLLQRTRCYYFYDEAARCNKRRPCSGCDAIGGFNRIHAILGASEQCIAVHPSDMCVALAALEAKIHLEGRDGGRVVPMEQFHLLPGETPEIETCVNADELITSVELPPAAPLFQRARYRKVRDRSSFAFALVSVAAAVKVVDGTLAEIRLALGGVAHKPWRARVAEEMLRNGPANATAYRRAAEAELAEARGQGHNDFKIELARRTITGVLTELTQGGDR